MRRGEEGGDAPAHHAGTRARGLLYEAESAAAAEAMFFAEDAAAYKRINSLSCSPWTPPEGWTP